MAGTAAALALHAGSHESLRQFLTWIALLQAITTMFNLNPLARSDGSWTYSILLGDYRLLEAAWGATSMARPWQVWTYRSLCLCYVLASVVAVTVAIRVVFLR
jgi:hypothetical protein